MDDSGEQEPTEHSEEVQAQAEAWFKAKQRYLLAEGFIEETSPGQFKLTEGGEYYAEERIKEVMRHLFGRESP